MRNNRYPLFPALPRATALRANLVSVAYPCGARIVGQPSRPASMSPVQRVLSILPYKCRTSPWAGLAVPTRAGQSRRHIRLLVSGPETVRSTFGERFSGANASGIIEAPIGEGLLLQTSPRCQRVTSPLTPPHSTPDLPHKQPIA